MKKPVLAWQYQIIYEIKVFGVVLHVVSFKMFSIYPLKISWVKKFPHAGDTKCLNVCG